MQSERSRCCHVTERARARARPGENAPTHGRQFFRTNVLVRPSSYSSSFPFSSSCSFASCCLSHASYPRLRRVRRLFITRVQTPTSPTSSVCFRECLRGQGKNVPSLSAMSFLSGIRGILTRTISRARARCAKSESRIEAFSNDWPDK